MQMHHIDGMLNLKNYTDKQIDDALRMKNSSRKVSFRYDLLNRNDAKIGTLDGIVSAGVSYGEFRAIKRSAAFTINEYLQKEIDYLSDRIQPWFILHMPDGGTVEWPLGIFLLESPDRNIAAYTSTREIGAYDKTLIIDEFRFTARHFVEKGTNYIAAVTKILSMAGITKIKIEDSDIPLSRDMEFAVGVKAKEAIAELLNAINYNSIYVDAQGYVCAEPYITPSQRPWTQRYSAGSDSILHPSFTESLAIAGRANVFTRVATNLENNTELVSTYINEDPLSPVSTVNRGRRIVDFDTIDNIETQELLDSYVKRIAADSMSAYGHLSFETALMPTHGSADTLYLYIPTVFPAAQKFSETSWEMDLTFDGVMRHEARKVVQL